jgi:hypothetical protein
MKNSFPKLRTGHLFSRCSVDKISLDSAHTGPTKPAFLVIFFFFNRNLAPKLS